MLDSAKDLNDLSMSMDSKAHEISIMKKDLTRMKHEKKLYQEKWKELEAQSVENSTLVENIS